MLYPGRHYVIHYSNRASDRNWLTDAEYVGISGENTAEPLLHFKVPNGTERRIRPDRIHEIMPITKEPIPGQREEIVARMQQIRAERHPETQTDEYKEQQRQRVQAWLEDRRQTQALIEEIAAQHITEMRAARKVGYRIVKHARQTETTT